MSGDQTEFKQKLRSRIQQSIDAAEEKRKKELFKRRIDLARKGLKDYQERKIGSAVNAFSTYLKVLEEFKGVPEGGLTPALFDLEKDIHELLLISGVYWDMVKLYDRTKSPEKQKDFEHYVSKYLIFAKNMPYQALCAETVRKYISTDRPVHKDAFKNLYKQLGGEKCFVAGALVDLIAPTTLPILREYRDNRLQKSRSGRAFVLIYYQVGPLLATCVERSPLALRRLLARAVDRAGVLLQNRSDS